ncbi:MAG: hypothetical protein RMM53_10855, partial [Bacteroidia bacterium]|nr:hypothetical protein [Bacteroidia bacterium]
DAAWNPGVDGAVHAVKTATISGTPFIFVGGTFANAGGNAHQNLAKINRSTAASVASWKPDPNYVVRAIDWHSDEGLFVGGDFTNISGQSQSYFARLDEVSGNLTAGFSPSFNEKVRAIRIVSAAGTGKVLVGGDFFIVNGATRRGFVSLNTADGSNHTLDAGLNTDAEVHAIALDGDNNLYLGGKFANAQGKDRAGLVKLAADGLVIDEWVSNVPGVETVRALAITQERLFVAQTGDKFAYHSRQRFAIVDLAGQFVLPTPDFNGDVHALAFDPNVIYVGGAFTHYGNSRLARIGVVNNQLVLDGSWPQEGPQDVVRAIDLTSSHVYIGGDFTTVGTTSRSYLARISKTAGLLDQTWTPSVNNTVRAVLAQGSRVYVGGDFTAPQNRLAAIKVVDGTHDATFDISANGRVNALAFDGSTMYFAGEFSQVTDNSIPAGRVAVAAFDPATNTVWWWDPGPWTTSIKDLHVAAGRLYAAHYNDPADFCLSEMQLHPATPVTPHRLGVIAASTDRANYIAFWGGRLYFGGEFSQINGNAVNYHAGVKGGNTSEFTVTRSGSCPVYTFTLTYTGGATGGTYNWDCDGCNEAPLSGQGPHNVTWSSPGVKNVRLNVVAAGCDYGTYVLRVHVPGPWVSISPSAAEVCSGGSVLLTADV